MAHALLLWQSTSGVPQGTVLGPSLFFIYINDLPSCINHSTTRLFADDCIIYQHVRSQEDARLLQEDINAIQEWASLWLIRFNISKCCSLHFTQAKIHKTDYTYYLYDVPLSTTDHCKYLGVTLQSNLKFDIHVQEIVAKANRTQGLIRRNVKTTSTTTEGWRSMLIKPW